MTRESYLSSSLDCQWLEACRAGSDDSALGKRMPVW